MVFYNGKIILPDGVFEDVSVEINDGYITSISRVKPVDGVDLNGEYLSPAFVDIHTHGGYGYDFMDSDIEAFDGVLKFHLDNGTTSVVATSVTSPVASILKFIDKAREYKSLGGKYAKLLGVHLEGPYLSVKNKGAQKEEYILRPDSDDYGFIIDNKDIIKTVTISPELDADGKMTKTLTENGITVCGGHDDGIYPEFMPSVENGLKHLTHIYCAMSDVRFKDGRRNVGLREYGLIDERLTAEMIADNRHIPPQLAKMIINAKGADKVALVSDSLRCAGQPMDGKLYRLGDKSDAEGQLFKVADGVAVLADGTRYAGSITPVRQMVKNLIDAGIDVAKAVKMGSLTPAKIVGEKDIGSIEVGKKADLCVLDEQFNVIKVYKDGRLVKG